MSSHVIFALFLNSFSVLFTLLSHYFMDRDVIMGSRLNMDTDHWKWHSTLEHDILTGYDVHR